MTELGDLLRRARTQRGWTLRDAEAHTGIHNAHLSQIENGTIARPKQPMLWTLSEHYHLDYAELLRLTGHATTDTEAQSKRQLAGALLRGLEDLDEDDQQQLLAELADLRRRRKEST
jgi:HTH-type transcriptional regulator, competence development regulator